MMKFTPLPRSPTAGFTSGRAALCTVLESRERKVTRINVRAIDAGIDFARKQATEENPLGSWIEETGQCHPRKRMVSKDPQTVGIIPSAYADGTDCIANCLLPTIFCLLLRSISLHRPTLVAVLLE